MILSRTVRAEIIDTLNSEIKSIENIEDIERIADSIISSMRLPVSWREYITVEVSNAINEELFTKSPMNRRLLLIPQCLKIKHGCLGYLEDTQFVCIPSNSCKLCTIEKLRKNATKLGYFVLVADTLPIFSMLPIRKKIDGILGICCVNNLSKILPLTVKTPVYVIPLLKKSCESNVVDTRRVLKIMKRFVSSEYQPKDIAKLIIEKMFEKMVKYLPEPQEWIEHIGNEYVKLGGKRLRPLLTVATFLALTDNVRIPPEILKIALAIEIFHKASLIHDDIEDDAEYRYGVHTLHKKYGVAVAINVGDYLAGLGYNLISSTARSLENRFSKIIEVVSESHTDLTKGQNKELMSHYENITIGDVLKIYSLKTSSAFRCAILLGAILGKLDTETENENYLKLQKYAEHLGIAFQILNDIGDFETTGNDISKGRISVFYTLANSLCLSEDKLVLEKIYKKKNKMSADINKIREIYNKYDIVEHARELVVKHKEYAKKSIFDLTHQKLRETLLNMVEYIC